MAPSWYQDRTKRAHKEIIHICTALPKGPEPANMAGSREEEQQVGVKEATRVALVPGDTFGAPNTVRICFAPPMEFLERAMDALGEALAALR